MCESAEMIGPSVTMWRISAEDGERECPGATPRPPGQRSEHRRRCKAAGSGPEWVTALSRQRGPIAPGRRRTATSSSGTRGRDLRGTPDNPHTPTQARFDDPAGVARPAELIAELGLVAIEGDQLVTTKGLELLRGR